jgi:hypothetical protein
VGEGVRGSKYGSCRAILSTPMSLTMIANIPSQPFANEAERARNGIHAARNALAEKLAWLRVPAVSGLECIQALVRDGFAVEFVGSAYADLTRHDAFVQVPLVAILEPAVLMTVLGHAKIGPARFMALLEQ